MPTNTRIFDRGPLASVRPGAAASGVVLGPNADVADEVGEPEKLFDDAFPNESACPHREMKKVAAGGHLRNVGVAFRIVRELMMSQVLNPVMMGGAQHWEHGEEVRNHFVEQPIAEEHVVAGFVRERRQAVLARPDSTMATSETGTFQSGLGIPSSACQL